MEQINLEEYRQAIIDSYTSYTDVMRHFDTSWYEDGKRLTKVWCIDNSRRNIYANQ